MRRLLFREKPNSSPGHEPRRRTVEPGLSLLVYLIGEMPWVGLIPALSGRSPTCSKKRRTSVAV